DSPFQEIHALHFDDKGMLFAAAISGRPSTSASPSPTVTLEAPSAETSRAPIPTVTAEVTSISVVDVGGSAAQARETRGSTKGAVYRINADGVWDQLWESRDDSPYDIAFDADGALLVGTGNKGKLYRLEGDPTRTSLVTRAGGEQITTFH